MILNLTHMIVFVAVQEIVCGNFFQQQSAADLFLSFVGENSWCGWKEKNLKNVTPHVSETRLDIRRLQMIVFLILLFQGQYHDMVIMKQFKKSRVDTKKIICRICIKNCYPNQDNKLYY